MHHSGFEAFPPLLTTCSDFVHGSGDLIPKGIRTGPTITQKN